VPIGAPLFKDAEFAKKMEEDDNSSYPPTPLNASIAIILHCFTEFVSFGSNYVEKG